VSICSSPHADERIDRPREASTHGLWCTAHRSVATSPHPCRIYATDPQKQYSLCRHQRGDSAQKCPSLSKRRAGSIRGRARFEHSRWRHTVPGTRGPTFRCRRSHRTVVSGGPRRISGDEGDPLKITSQRTRSQQPTRSCLRVQRRHSPHFESVTQSHLCPRVCWPALSWMRSTPSSGLTRMPCGLVGLNTRPPTCRRWSLCG
jgi:hypothetical protein